MTRRANKANQNQRVKINEIDELKEAMEILFGEQQEQTNSKEKVKFMSQEQSLNPCYYQNQNSQCLKPGENYYYFQLNEMCQFQEANDKPSTLNELLDRNSPDYDIVDTAPQQAESNRQKIDMFSHGTVFGATMKNLLP